MRVDQIEIHTGTVDFDYEPLRAVEAKRTQTTVFSTPPSIEDVNSMLRELASNVGANAVLNVAYRKTNGYTGLGLPTIKATGLAVRKVADTVSCPSCAETIKRAAKRCRFCGAENTDRADGPATKYSTAHQVTTDGHCAAAPSMNYAPLRTDDGHSRIVWGIVAAVLILGVIQILSVL